jgi:hypothetical protein
MDLKAAFPHGMKYVRHNTQPADIKLYDAATLCFVCKQPVASNDVGLLRISYNVRLRTPQVTKPITVMSGLYTGVKSSSTTPFSYTDFSGAGTLYQDLAWTTGSSASNNAGGSITRVVLPGTGDALRLQPGTYELSCTLPLQSTLASAGGSPVQLLCEFATTPDEGVSFAQLADKVAAYANFVSSGVAQATTVSWKLISVFTDVVDVAVLMYATVAEAMTAGNITIPIGMVLTARLMGQGNEQVIEVVN